VAPNGPRQPPKGMADQPLGQEATAGDGTRLARGRGLTRGLGLERVLGFERGLGLARGLGLERGLGLTEALQPHVTPLVDEDRRVLTILEGHVEVPPMAPRH